MGGDNYARSSLPDDITKLLEYERGAIQIDFQDHGRRCLRGRDASGMDDAAYSADCRGCFDERVNGSPRGNVYDCGANLEPGVIEDFGSGIDIILTLIR